MYEKNKIAVFRADAYSPAPRLRYTIGCGIRPAIFLRSGFLCGAKLRFEYGCKFSFQFKRTRFKRFGLKHVRFKYAVFKHTGFFGAKRRFQAAYFFIENDSDEFLAAACSSAQKSAAGSYARRHGKDAAGIRNRRVQQKFRHCGLQQRSARLYHGQIQRLRKY